MSLCDDDHCHQRRPTINSQEEDVFAHTPHIWVLFYQVVVLQTWIKRVSIHRQLDVVPEPSGSYRNLPDQRRDLGAHTPLHLQLARGKPAGGETLQETDIEAIQILAGLVVVHREGWPSVNLRTDLQSQLTLGRS
jgi:hypothetical protein